MSVTGVVVGYGKVDRGLDRVKGEGGGYVNGEGKISWPPGMDNYGLEE